jgi:hypothetical protein
MKIIMADTPTGTVAIASENITYFEQADPSMPNSKQAPTNVYLRDGRGLGVKMPFEDFLKLYKEAIS